MGKHANWICAIRRLISAFFCLGFGIVLASNYDAWYMTKPEFGENTMVYKLMYLLLALHGNLWCYIAFLVIGEANYLAAGFGFSENGYDGFVSMNVINFAISRDVSHFTTNWNVQIHYWLKYYVMLRMMDRS